MSYLAEKTRNSSVLMPDGLLRKETGLLYWNGLREDNCFVVGKSSCSRNILTSTDLCTQSTE
jgi:hypothetical protein